MGSSELTEGPRSQPAWCFQIFYDPGWWSGRGLNPWPPTWQASTVPSQLTRWVFLGMGSCTPLSPSLISHFFVFITFGHHLWSITIGSLRCHDDDENENVKKEIGSGKQNNNLHVHHASLYNSWPSLHDYDMNCIISRFINNVNIRRWIPLSLFKLEYLSKELTPGKFAYIGQSEGVGIIALKFHRMRSHSLSDVSTAVAIVACWTP